MEQSLVDTLAGKNEKKEYNGTWKVLVKIIIAHEKGYSQSNCQEIKQERRYRKLVILTCSKFVFGSEIEIRWGKVVYLASQISIV